MHDPSDPAPSILALVEFLQSDLQPGDLFRGQTRDFPALIPSAFRKSLIAETASEPLVRIDQSEFYSQQTETQKRRYAMMNNLISRLGSGLGNHVAQQYGLSSECLDVTEDPLIAAFFATKRWPEYDHTEAGDVGVIYRFRSTPEDLAPPELSFLSMSDWFERGASDEAFFDFFVSAEQQPKVFDRDKWTDPGRACTVETLPLTVRWRDLLDAVEDARDGSGKSVASHSGDTMRDVLDIDWRLTRVAAQKGGFIRPRFAWEALVSRFMKVQQQPIRESDGYPWPRAYPSCAIKQKFIGVENLRHRSGFQAFFFRHGSDRVRGLYRRFLWPEPSEDPLYQILWRLAILRLMDMREMPPIDDVEDGLLDRGYRVKGEAQTRSGRELDDLLRGQFEDAEEAVKGEPTERDWMIYCGALAQMDRASDALEKAESALIEHPDSIGLLLTASSLLRGEGRWTRALELLDRAAQLEPAHPEVLLVQADLELKRKDYVSAAKRLRQAISHPDLALQPTPIYEYYTRAALAATMVGQADLREEAVAWIRSYNPFDFGGFEQWLAESVSREEGRDPIEPPV